jgi:hypothetical protein
MGQSSGDLFRDAEVLFDGGDALKRVVDLSSRSALDSSTHAMLASIYAVKAKLFPKLLRSFDLIR